MLATPPNTASLRPWSGVRLAVVEDDHDLRRDLSTFFRWQGADVLEALSAEAFWEQSRLHGLPDLLVLDLGLPGESGLNVTGKLRQQAASIGIVMLTAFGADTDRIKGLDLGADAYLVKGTSLEVLEATCRSVLRRLNSSATGPVPAEVHDKASVWLLEVLQARLRTPAGHEVRLTHQELVFLTTLMQVPGEAVSRSDLLRRMGRPDTLEQWRNLDGCVARLRRKVQALQTEELPVRSCYGQGYAFGAPVHVQRG